MFVILPLIFSMVCGYKCLRTVWRYQWGKSECVLSEKNRKHNGQKKKYKQRSTKHTHQTKDRVAQTSLKTGGDLKCSGRVSSSFYNIICSYYLPVLILIKMIYTLVLWDNLNSGICRKKLKIYKYSYGAPLC